MKLIDRRFRVDKRKSLHTVHNCHMELTTTRCSDDQYLDGLKRILDKFLEHMFVTTIHYGSMLLPGSVCV